MMCPDFEKSTIGGDSSHKGMTFGVIVTDVMVGNILSLHHECTIICSLVLSHDEILTWSFDLSCEMG